MLMKGQVYKGKNKSPQTPKVTLGRCSRDV